MDRSKQCSELGSRAPAGLHPLAGLRLLLVGGAQPPIVRAVLTVAGADVLGPASVPGALAMLERVYFDAVVLAADMQTSGLRFLRHLRSARGPLAAARVLALVPEDAPIAELPAGVDAVMFERALPSEIIATVGKLVRTREPASQTSCG